MLKWFLRSVLAGIIIGLICALVMLSVNLLKTSSVFIVRTVEVRGVAQTDMELLEKVYQPYVGKNIFTEITPSSLMTEDPWVVRIEIKRSIPDKLVVIVWEEQGLLTYREGSECYVHTASGNDIPTGCEGVDVEIIDAGIEEFKSFIDLYNESDVLKNNYVILKNGFFWVKEDGVILVGNFVPGVFAENYRVYVEKIKPNYRKVERVDLTVDGRVYVKGVLNG